MKIKVKCELIVELEWHSCETGNEALEHIQFMVEEKRTCWGCALRGQSTLLEVDGRKYAPGGVDSKGEYTPPSLEENHPPGSVDRN